MINDTGKWKYISTFTCICVYLSFQRQVENIINYGVEGSSGYYLGHLAPRWTQELLPRRRRRLVRLREHRRQSSSTEPLVFLASIRTLSASLVTLVLAKVRLLTVRCWSVLDLDWARVVPVKGQPCQAVHDCGTEDAAIEPAAGSPAARNDGRSTASNAEINNENIGSFFLLCRSTIVCAKIVVLDNTGHSTEFPTRVITNKTRTTILISNFVLKGD